MYLKKSRIEVRKISTFNIHFFNIKNSIRWRKLVKKSTGVIVFANNHRRFYVLFHFYFNYSSRNFTTLFFVIDIFRRIKTKFLNRTKLTCIASRYEYYVRISTRTFEILFSLNTLRTRAIFISDTFLLNNFENTSKWNIEVPICQQETFVIWKFL